MPGCLSRAILASSCCSGVVVVFRWSLVLGRLCRSQVSWCCCMWVAMSERRASGCVLKVIGWIWRMRRISAITAWRRQLLFVAGVSWHARPACSSVVEGGGMGQVGCVRCCRCCPWSVPIGVSWAVVVFGVFLVCVMGVVA